MTFEEGDIMMTISRGSLNKRNQNSGGSASRWLSLLPWVGIFVVLASIAPALASEDDAPHQSSQHGGRRLGAPDDKTIKHKDLRSMKAGLEMARAKFWKKLEDDYGEYRDKIYLTTVNETSVSIGRVLFGHSEVAWSRLVRKISIKILQALEKGQKQKFVFATGGHSAAAAHGDYVNVSYTRTVMRNLLEPMEAVGIDFDGRPYAMGATSSGFEISSCMKEVFGTDFDLITWDYGMTTSGKMERYEHWVYRAALTSGGPAILFLHESWRPKALVENMEKLGMPMFLFELKEIQEIGKNFPDQQEMSEDQIKKMPKYVRRFRCGPLNYEKGDPKCEPEKYLEDPDPKEPCNHRLYRVRWHPGWKWHAWYGNLMSLWILDIMEDSIKLISEEGSDQRALMLRLASDQEKDHRLFLNNEDPPMYPLTYDKDYKTEFTEIPLDVLYKKPNICHTGRLPSEIRYKGILTEVPENTTTGVGAAHYLDYSYDRGQADNVRMEDQREIKFISPNISDPPMPLYWSPSLYQESCKKHLIQIDHPDYFMANSYAQYNLLLPNNRQENAYGKHALQGYVAIFLANCHWGCPGDSINDEDIQKNGLIVTVNGVEVTQFEGPIAQGFFLKHNGGFKFNPNKDGKFELTFQTKDEQKYLRLGSLAIW